jgi:tricorn protease
MTRFALCALLAVLLAPPATASDEAPLLLRQPSLSETQIVFSFAGDLWLVERAGGEARRLTAGAGIEARPYFSPDGRSIAFTGQYDGNTDVYVVDARGGTPRRLTFHPGPDFTVGWSPDGKRVLFRSQRATGVDDIHLYLVDAAGGVPERLPLPTAFEGSLSPDGKRLAYVPNLKWQPGWKRYRGGQTTPVWLADLSTLALERVPRENSNDSSPAWLGDRVFFLSDRGGKVTLWSYDTATREVRSEFNNDGLDLKNVSAGPGGLVFERFGEIWLYDLAARAAHRVPIGVHADLPGVRPRFAEAGDDAAAAGLSPHGARALFQVRGEVFTAPVEHGDIRNVTRTPGVMERDPAWSPDGRTIAYLSDESGEYALHLAAQNGLGPVRKIPLGDPPSFFYRPQWSPDGKKLALTDKRLNLWVVDAASGALTRVDADRYDDPPRTLDPAWSPDSRLLAYTKRLPSHQHAVFLRALAEPVSRQVTDGLADARHPVFDRGGKYLYFTASTNVGLSASWLDLSSVDHPIASSVYALTLAKDTVSPVAPQSDEEETTDRENATTAKGDDDDHGAAKEEDEIEDARPVVVRVDWEGLAQRAVALPAPPRNYLGLETGEEGTLFLLEGPPVMPIDDEEPPPVTVQKLTLEDRKVEKFAGETSAFIVSSDGKKALLHGGDSWRVVSTDEAPTESGGEIDLDGLEVWVDPRAEWRQMFREVWRIERDFLYDPRAHGYDLAAAQARYAPYLERLGHRADLNYLFEEMLGGIEVGHTFVAGGDLPDADTVPGGLLGADYEVANGRYRFARVYGGDSWDPELEAPLAQPGAAVAAGEYLLAVEGREVTPPQSVYSFFENTAGKQVRLRVGPDPGGKGSREIEVVPIEDESELRYRAWVEDNRRLVDKLSGGRLAYVHLPDTGGGGFESFNRYFFAQLGKEGAIVDDRYNHGGLLADYVVDLLRRQPLSGITSREGEDSLSPAGAIYGPKAMLVNMMAGSGGDAMPWYFRKLGLGPLVGTRTWGGLVGIFDYPQLLDGGQVTAPRVALYDLNGQWGVENTGVSPDVEVEMTPQSARGGHDPQIEKAVELLLATLRDHPLPRYTKPEYPSHYLPR